MPKIGILCLIAIGFSLAACGTYSSTTVDLPGQGSASRSDAGQPPSLDGPTVKSERPATDADKVIVTNADITDRTYVVIGDIDVTVNKTTIFDKDPTPALVDVELKEKAAELGADAVILVRYGTVGISPFSWGSLNGEGRAIYFVDN